METRLIDYAQSEYADSEVREPLVTLAAQLDRLKTDRLDYYLVHALNGPAWDKMLALGLLIHVQQKTGRYAIAGLVIAAMALGQGAATAAREAAAYGFEAVRFSEDALFDRYQNVYGQVAQEALS